MSNHFECVCDPGFIQVSEDNCEKQLTCDENNQGKPCNHFSTCNKSTTEENKYNCDCNDSYTLSEKICVPEKCYGSNCKSGKCVVDPDTDLALCSCNIGTILNEESKQCDAQGETKCDLKCGKNEECVLEETFYRCNCKKGFVYKPETKECSFSLFNILNLSIVFIISLIFLYII